MSQRSRFQSVDITRTAQQGLTCRGRSLLIIGIGKINLAALPIRRRVGWVERVGQMKIGQRLVDAVRFAEQLRPASIQPRLPRLQLDRRAQLLQG